MDMSEEPFCVEIYRKKGTGTGHRSHFVASGDHVLDGSWGTCYKSHFVWKFTGKMPHTLFGTRILCGNLQEKTHMDMLEEPFCVEIYRKNAAHTFTGTHFVWKFTGKNAHGHCTRAILCGNLQEKCRTPPSPPGPTRAPFYSYRKNPFSVATLFGEKNLRLSFFSE